MSVNDGFGRSRGSGARACMVSAVALLALGGLACNQGPAGEASASDGAPPVAGAAAAATPPPAAAAQGAEPTAGAALVKQFPPPDHLDKIIKAYGIANDYPDLLTGLPCYCPCELYGHGGVIDCHRSQHAAMCNVCLDEAVEAGQLYEAQLRRGEADIPAAQAGVKDRYRRALMAQTAQQFPGMNTAPGQAFLQVCSDCHQPPSPAMHMAMDWDASLARMQQHARDRGSLPPAETWENASSYVKSVAGQVPASTVAQFRQSLQTTVEHLQAAEGDAAYYPSVRDPVLDPAWAVRMAAAYNLARELPAELLAATPTTCEACLDAGHTDLLACLNSWHAITCETAIEEVEALGATRGQQ